MASRANSPPQSLATRPPLQFRFADRAHWQSQIEPQVAELVAAAGPRLRRHRAKIGRCVLEYVGDSEAASQLFAGHWNSARPAEPPDTYCYQFGEISHSKPDEQPSGPGFSPPECTMCVENGRALLTDSSRYAHVHEVCLRLLSALAACSIPTIRSRSPQPSTDSWCLLPAACVEYQASSGSTRCVALLGANTECRAAHSYGLCLAKAGNGLVSDSLACVQVATGKIVRTEKCLWWPVNLAGNFPHLVPLFSTSPSEGLELDDELTEKISQYRDAADLTRAVEDGLFAEGPYRNLCDRLASAREAHAMIDPQDLVGAERCFEHAQLTHLVHIGHEPDSMHLLREITAEDSVSRLHSEWEAWTSDKSVKRTARVYKSCLKQLMSANNIGAAVLNTQLPLAQTQFCLRQYLEGHCDSVRLLSAHGFADPALCQSMRIEVRECEDPAMLGQRKPAFFHGTKNANLVSFERNGRRVEMVAFDPAAEGYAQVRAVWPGQVAEFFARHATARVHELFTESRHSPHFSQP